MDFSLENNTQLNIFENSNPRHLPLMQAVDKINGISGAAKNQTGFAGYEQSLENETGKVITCLYNKFK